MKRTVAVVSIEAEVEIADGGYLGWENATVQEHVDSALKKIKSQYQFGVKKSQIESWKPIKATATIKRVVMEEV